MPKRNSVPGYRRRTTAKACKEHKALTSQDALLEATPGEIVEVESYRMRRYRGAADDDNLCTADGCGGQPYWWGELTYLVDDADELRRIIDRLRAQLLKQQGGGAS